MYARIFTILLVAVLLFPAMTACATVAGIDPSVALSQPPLDGDIIAMQYGATLNGMRTALREAGYGLPRIFTKDALMLFRWPMSQGWGFAVLDRTRTGLIPDNGNYVNVETMKSLQNGLAGWKQAAPDEVPAWVTTALGGIQAFVGTLAGSLTTMYLVPAPCPTINCLYPTSEE
jgi:hypothetical protein